MGFNEAAINLACGDGEWLPAIGVEVDVGVPPADGLPDGCGDDAEVELAGQGRAAAEARVMLEVAAQGGANRGTVVRMEADDDWGDSGCGG